MIPITTSLDGRALDDLVTMVGYGQTSPGAEDFDEAGTRRRANPKLNYITDANLVFNQLDTGGSILAGDSGGPMLAVVDDVERVVGVSSRGNLTGSMPAGAYTARVTYSLPWISSVLAGTPNVSSCQSCMKIAGGGVRECRAYRQACDNDEGCEDYSRCIDKCQNGGEGPTEQCRSQCTQGQAPALYDGVLQCGCQSCASACGSVCDGVSAPPSPPEIVVEPIVAGTGGKGGSAGSAGNDGAAGTAAASGGAGVAGGAGTSGSAATGAAGDGSDDSSGGCTSVPTNQSTSVLVAIALLLATLRRRRRS